MARDFYASPFGVAYAAYMERPKVVRWVARTVWAGDTRPYFESMRAVAEVPEGGTIVDCPCGAGPALRALDRDRDVRYIGADLSPAMLRRIRKRAAERGASTGSSSTKPTRPTCRSRTGSPTSSSPTGACTASRSPPRRWLEAARVMKPGGRMVGASFVHSADTLRQRLLIRPGLGDFGPMGTEDEIRGWLEDAGLRPTSWLRGGSMLYFEATLATA